MNNNDICTFCGHSYRYHDGEDVDSNVICTYPKEHYTKCNCRIFKSQGIVNRQIAQHESEGKLALDQLPIKFLRGVAAVLNFGMLKYAKDNWKQGTDWSEFYGSTQRHLLAWWDGEDNDPESGLSHLAHAACNIAFLIYYQDRNVGKDDRDKSPTTQQHLGDKNPGDRETTS
jgi:hypothetical protein